MSSVRYHWITAAQPHNQARPDAISATEWVTFFSRPKRLETSPLKAAPTSGKMGTSQIRS